MCKLTVIPKVQKIKESSLKCISLAVRLNRAVFRSVFFFQFTSTPSYLFIYILQDRSLLQIITVENIDKLPVSLPFNSIWDE